MSKRVRSEEYWIKQKEYKKTYKELVKNRDKDPEKESKHKEYHRVYRDGHKNEHKAYCKDYYLKNKDSLSESAKDYYLKNKDRIRIRSKNYRDNNKDKLSAVRKKHWLEHGKEAYNRTKHKTRERCRDWERNNPDKMKNKSLKRYFGITLQDFNLMLENQGNKCGICSSEFDGIKVIACVDHSHRTGIIRGVLCRKCNIGISCGLNEDPTLFNQAIYWLSGKTCFSVYDFDPLKKVTPSYLFTLKTRYKLSFSAYENIYNRQYGRCGICEKKFNNDNLNKSNIDHCHLDGHVRGILCGACNRSLGLLKDSIELLNKAIEWLKRGETNENS